MKTLIMTNLNGLNQKMVLSTRRIYTPILMSYGEENNENILAPLLFFQRGLFYFLLLSISACILVASLHDMSSAYTLSLSLSILPCFFYHYWVLTINFEF